ncbi:MAG: transketolase [Anaerolineae bacterium]|nr:transketolase [Anaerolineae bacterium]
MTDPHLDTRAFAKSIRKHALRMVHRANTSHIGTCLSMADLLAALYTQVLNIDPAQPAWAARDRLILSKGHGAAILYAALAERGFFPPDWLETFSQDGSLLTGHVNHRVPGIDFSTGSLGHGLSVACGMAIAARRDAAAYRVFALLSDGELDEGSTWEPILFAPQYRLDNLVAIVDFNKIQSFGTVAEVLELQPLADKWRACRWAVREIDGHDHTQIAAALRDLPFEPGKPSVIIAHTVKGKGVSYMEGQLAWHYKAPNAQQLAQALAEVDAAP